MTSGRSFSLTTLLPLLLLLPPPPAAASFGRTTYSLIHSFTHSLPRTMPEIANRKSQIATPTLALSVCLSTYRVALDRIDRIDFASSFHFIPPHPISPQREREWFPLPLPLSGLGTRDSVVTYLPTYPYLYLYLPT